MPVTARLETFEADDRRSQGRRRLHLESSLSASGDEVLVHDISTTGVLLETAAKLQPFESLQFDLPEVGAMQAVVVWNSGPFFGCEFASPIPRAAISAALLRSPVATKLLVESSLAVDEAHEAEILDHGEALPLATRGWIILGVSLTLWALILWAVGIL
jgi:hypothetical protein